VVRLDCARLGQVSSDWVRVLWDAYEACKAVRSRIHLVSPSKGLVDTLRVLDLAEFFDVGMDAQAVTAEQGPDEFQSSTTGVYTDRFEADRAQIDAALEKFLQFLRRLRISKATEFELQTIFYEVVTNIRRHARLDPGAQIAFTATATAHQVVLSFIDRGLAFDPTTSSRDFDFVAAARAGRTGGFGIAMLHRMASRISYAREHNANHLTIEKERTL
jgi:anti-sigma regulatory factor (Ser/Thr protein kinase)